MRKTEKTIAGQTKVVLEVSVFDDDDIEEIKLHFRKEPNISVSLYELEVLNLFEISNYWSLQAVSRRNADWKLCMLCRT